MKLLIFSLIVLAIGSCTPKQSPIVEQPIRVVKKTPPKPIIKVEDHPIVEGPFSTKASQCKTTETYIGYFKVEKDC